MGEKSHTKFFDERWKKVLRKDDPFDQLIFQFATSGVLNVAVVDIKGRSKGFSSRRNLKKHLLHRKKRSS